MNTYNISSMRYIILKSIKIMHYKITRFKPKLPHDRYDYSRSNIWNNTAIIVFHFFDISFLGR